MAEIKLTVETGRTLGSRPANRLRNDGNIPAVVYGHGSDPTPVSVVWRELRAALTTDAGLNALLDLQVDGESRLAIVKDIQRHPVRNTVSHVDFMLINRDEMLSVDIPVLAEGEALKVTRENGMVDQVLFTLTVNAKPADIPNELVVDISELSLGDSIRIADIALPSGVTTDADPEDAVVVTALLRAEEEEVAEGEGEEGEEGDAEGAEGAEGEGGGASEESSD
jgi:large subunit ribosomal protein L25